ncbi:uncharacterized protein LOC143914567 [Arctopsyche grandis]|uniref:uncharacterized protein LOC143914567 n=1 Tax=Arctopsyche grandis TaxID=121162 RepID=UPI00406D7D51
MCEQTEVTYLDGDVVWVKLGNCWWPGEVWGFDRLPPGLLKSFRKLPIAVVKFFQEEAFEYVKNLNLIYKYNCARKHEFIKKGLDLFRSKHTHMDKFPEDVCTAERRTDGNPDIITDDEFLPKKKESYANIFGTPSDSSSPLKKMHGKRGRPPSSKWTKKFNTGASTSLSDTPKVNRQRFVKNSDYKARILVQPNNSNVNEKSNQFETSNDSSNVSMELGLDEESPKKLPQREYTSPAQPNSVIHTCPTCNFTSTRLNVIILHNKSHSASSATYYTPVKKPKARSPLLKEKSKSENLPSVCVDENNDFSNRRKRSAKVEHSPVRSKIPHDDSPSSGRLSANSKLKSKEKTICPPKKKLKVKEKESKKPKTDVEIKNSLLADWSEDSNDESMDILASLKLTENQNTSTISVDKSVEQDASNLSDEKSPVKVDRNSIDKSESGPIKPVKSDETPKTEKREQASCFDFEEDEDLQIERLDRKIPRLSIKSDESKKSLESIISDSGNDTALKSISGDTVPSESDNLDLDSEVNNLLKETVLPDLPSLPTNSNFQKSKVVKVPDKEKDSDSQYVFKTKTFFRSRHSRSQDAIEKYVADNTSTDKPPTYMEEAIDPEKSNDVNLESSTKNQYDVTVDDVTIPELTDPIKVTKYTPKLEFKKMKALNKHKLSSQDNNLKSPQIEATESFDNFCDNLNAKAITIDENISISKEKDDKSPKSESKDTESNSCDSPVTKNTVEITPTESDVQIAEALINLPCSNVNSADEKSTEIVIPSLSAETEMKCDENITSTIDKSSEVEPPKDIDMQLERQELKSPTKPDAVSSSDPSTESPKLFQILEESNNPMGTLTPSKVVKSQGKEKILNFDVDSSTPRTTETQKIMIRRKANLNSNSFGSNEFSDSSQELILSSKPKWSEDGVQTFTIEGASGANSDKLDPKLKQVIQKSPKHHTTASTDIVSHSNEKQLNIGSAVESTDSFVIKETNHSLSTIEVLKSESITTVEKASERLSPMMKSIDSSPMKMIIESSPTRKAIESPLKRPKIILKSVVEKSASPNILSRSVKAKTMKHLLLIDKSKNEKHMLNSQPDNSTQNFQFVDDFMKQNISPQAQTQKIIISSGKLPGGKKTQKIVLNALPKGQLSKSEIGKPESFSPQSTNIKHKTSSMKSNQPKIDIESPAGNAYMILTNSQGVQSKIVLTPEHQKLLFPKTKITSSTTIVTSTINSHKASAVSTPTGKIKEPSSNLANNEPQHYTQSVNVVPKQKGTILNSKGQIVMSGNSSKRTILTTMPGQAILTSKGQIIAPQSSIITSSAKLTTNLNKATTLITSNSQTVHSTKVVQSQKMSNRGEIHPSLNKDKTSGASAKASKVTSQSTTYMQGQIKDPALLLAQKSGSNVMRLTAAQFEHLTKTGQLIQKSPMQKNSNSQNKVPSGKVQNQRYILQRFVGGKPPTEVFDSKLDVKRTDVEFASGKHKMEATKPSTDVPPLAPIHSENVSGVHTKQKFIISANEAEKLFDLVDNKAFDSDDSNMFENLDKLIPATIIPTRKRDTATSDVARIDRKPQIQSKVEVTKEVVSVKPKEAESLSAVVEDSQVLSENSLSDSQNLLAIPGENFGGPPNSFFLCVEENGTLTPVNNQPLVLENNQLVPMAITSPLEADPALIASTSELPNVLKEAPVMESSQVLELPVEQAQRSILLNTGDQQLLIDHQTFLSLLAGDGQQLVTADGQNLVLQGGTQQLLSALAGSPEFANLLTSGQQILLNATGDAQQDGTPGEQQIIITAGAEGLNFPSDVQPNVNQDILAAALASTDVFQPESLIHETMNISTGAESIMMEIDSLSPKIQNVANPTVHSNVFETSSTLNQPIMSPLEHPTKKRVDENSTGAGLLAMANNPKIIPKNLEDSLAVIGVATTNVPTSLELPITVTNPRIAAKTTSPLSLSCSTVYQSGLLNSSIVSPGMSIFESEPPPNTIALTEITTMDYQDSLVEEKIQVVEDIPQPEQNEKELEKSFDDKVSLSTNDEDEESCKKSDPDKEHDAEIDSDQSKQPVGASSMPCLDESTSESYSEEPSNQIETKTYSPISMPILTDDTSERMPIDTADVSLKEHQDVSECSKDLDENTSKSIEGEELVAELVQEEVPNEDLSNGSNVSIEKDINLTNTEVIKNEDLQEANSEICIQALNSCDKETSDTNNVADEPMSPHIDPEAEEICAETPPDFTQNNSPMRYDDHDIEEESMIPNVAEENSIPDHVQEDSTVSLTSDIVAVPDSTSSSLDTTFEPPTSLVVFSESSSDDSNEIPIQPTISVSHHMVQNFSSLLNSADDKLDDCSDRETKLCENYDNHEETATVDCEMEGER